MNRGQYTIVGLGELLWDFLPGGKQLGGAPANFAYHAALLGNRSVIASRIGTDELGQQALSRLNQLGLRTSHVQLDSNYPTGTVMVEVDECGQPDFTIIEAVAWDHLEWTEQWQELAKRADAVCFGSLAQRSTESRETIQRFLEATASNALRIFDVNLRRSFYSADVLRRSLELCNVVKLNHQELPLVMEMLDLEHGEETESAKALLRAYELKMVSVTRGACGSLLVSEAEAVEHPGIQVEIRDAVGAGDAFTAALAHHYLRRATLEAINKAANRLGAWVASHAGATPAADDRVLAGIIGGAEGT